MISRRNFLKGLFGLGAAAALSVKPTSASAYAAPTGVVEDYIKIRSMLEGAEDIRVVVRKADVSMHRIPIPEEVGDHYIKVNGYEFKITGDEYTDFWDLTVTPYSDDTHKKFEAIDGTEYVTNMSRISIRREVLNDEFYVYDQNYGWIEVEPAVWYGLRDSLIGTE